jgi:uncharacterized membrane protein YkvA (DUF1232 family)
MNQMMTAMHDDFYRRLRERIRAWAPGAGGREKRWVSVVMLAPDVFHLLLRLLARPEVPAASKARLAAVVLYFVSPVDLLPEALVGLFGYADDVALSAWALFGMLNRVDESVLRQEWAGEGDVIAVLRSVMEKAEQMLGRKLWGRVRNQA